MAIQVGQTYPNPAKTLARWAWEAVRGVSPLSGWHDFRIEGEDAKDTVSAIERTALNPSGRKMPALDGKTMGVADFKVDVVSPLESWFPFAWFMGKGSVSSPEAGAYIHKLADTETAQSFGETLALKIWRDDGAAQSWNEVVPTELQLSFAEKQLSGLQVKGVGRANYWADPVRTAGTGTDFPRLRGLSALNFPPTVATARAWFQVTAFDSTTVTAKVKMSDGATFSGAAQVFQRGFWTQIQDEAGLNQGDNGSPLEVLFLAGDVFAVGDTFRVDNVHPVWVYSYPSLVAVNEIYGVLSIDAQEIEVKTGQITLTGPGAEVHGFGRRQDRRTRIRGLYGNAGTLAREVTDRLFRGRVEVSKTFRLELFLRSAVQLGAANLVQGIKVTRPLCRLINASTASVSNQTTYDETVPYEAFPSSDGTYPAATTFEFYNTIPDLTAA
jgi:hypothetical protein